MQYLHLSPTEAEQLYQAYGRSLKAAAAGAPDQSSSTATFEASGAAVGGKNRRSRSGSGDSDEDYAVRTRRKRPKIVHSDEEEVDGRNGLGNSDESADFEKEATNDNARGHDLEKEAGMDLFEAQYEPSDEEEVDELDPEEYNPPNATLRPALIKSPFRVPSDPLAPVSDNHATTSPGAQPQVGEEQTANVAEQNHFNDLEASAQECADGDNPARNSRSLSIGRRQETPAQAETTQGGDPLLTESQSKLQAHNLACVTPYVGFDYVHQLEDMKARLELIESQYERQASTTRRLNEDLFKEQQKSARLEEAKQRLQFENAKLSQQLEIAQRHQRTPFVIYKDWNYEKGGIDLKTSSCERRL
ncbi:hypothetical protein GALMADRAFT_147515 [Galerina marginata CBS 339.88]|uniref:Uncharacterized protein n=1 Tax=Galerina marginata (strain CBS 339.88) TaxID=685588 RepID=A0A067SA99_GALM3|nr:hypothetical protein GALMADRAFT_147515 [Galerina marginata CBS 339.88]